VVRISRTLGDITPVQVERTINYAWNCWSRYESRDNPWDEKGTELYGKYLKAKELAEGLKEYAPWLYPAGLP